MSNFLFFQAFAKVMSNIKVYRTHETTQLFAILHNLAKKVNGSLDSVPKKLIIVDSLSVLCSLVDKSDLTEMLSNFASICRYLVNNCRAVVLIVNTLRVLKGGALLFDNADANVQLKFKPSLGKYWYNVPNVRLIITHLENKRREIRVWKSSSLQNDSKCFVNIEDAGIFPS